MSQQEGNPTYSAQTTKQMKTNINNAEVLSQKYALSNMDAIDWLKSLKSESIDLVITDPAYESLEKHRAIGTTTRLKNSKASSNKWFTIFPNSRFPDLFSELFRVMKKNTHLYLFCDAETMFVAKPICEHIGFKFWKPLIWDKRKIGMGYHYRARHEYILFFEKGKRKLNNLGIPDILEAERIYNGYPTQKPTIISDILVQQSSEVDDIVIDPFCGSGSFGVSSVMHDRYFYGNDICQEAVEVTDIRLAQCDRNNKDKLSNKNYNYQSVLELS